MSPKKGPFQKGNFTFQLIFNRICSFFLGGRVNKSSNTQLFKAFFLFGSDPGNPFTSGFRGLSSSYSSSIAHHIGSKILLYLAVFFQNISNVVEFGCFFSGELDRGHYMYIIYIYVHITRYPRQCTVFSSKPSKLIIHLLLV